MSHNESVSDILFFPKILGHHDCQAFEEFPGLMRDHFKKFKQLLCVAWNIVTFRYVFGFLFSSPIQFIFLSPILVPLSLALAVAIIYVALGVVFVFGGLILLVFLSTSDVLPGILLLISTIYIIYKISIYVLKCAVKLIPFDYCKQEVFKVIQTMKEKVFFTRTLTTVYTSKMFEHLKKKVHKAIDRCRMFDYYRPLRTMVGYFLDVIFFTIETVKTLRREVLKKTSRPPRPNQSHFNTSHPRCEQIWTVIDDSSQDEATENAACLQTDMLVGIEKSATKGNDLDDTEDPHFTTRRPFTLPRPTKQDVEVVWRQTMELKERYTGTTNF